MIETWEAPKREKIGLDLANHGQSPRVSAAGMTYTDLANDVLSLLDTLDIPTACLIGHSVGGKVSMECALTNPHRVSELIVVDIAPVTYNPRNHASDASLAARAMAGVDLHTVQTRADADAALTVRGVENQAVRDFLLTNLVRNKQAESDASKYEWKANIQQIVQALPTLMAFLDHRASMYSGRTCVIRGGKSHYVPFDSMKAFTKLFPSTKLVTIADAGHWVQAQMPDQFCRSVNDFLAD